MHNHYARVLDVCQTDEALREILAVGATPAAARWMADEALMRVVRLEDVSGKAANVLKQEALALGAECAVARSVAAFDNTPQSVILIGSLRQHQALAKKLQAQPFGLADLADQVLAALDAYGAPPRRTLRIGEHDLPLGQRTLVMAIINVTPDSFSGDGLSGDPQQALRQAKRFTDEGADLLDVGGQSTRPGSEEVSADVEMGRVVPIIQRIAAEVGLPISIDTDKVEVAEAALDAGAGMINDVRALRGEGMVELAASRGVTVCLMHMLGSPRTMQECPEYDDLVADIYRFLADRVQASIQGGIARDSIIVDPGIGFGKTVNDNLTLLRRLREFRSLGCPVLIGTSRKSTIGKVLDLPADDRVEGTAATCACAILNGADIIRVHDVREMVRVARMTDAVVGGWHEQ